MKKIIKISLIILSLYILIIPVVNAGLFSSKDLTFSVDQKDYYFKTGENAVIPLNITNTYGKQITGMLTNTYVQEINQGGSFISSSNSQSTSFSVQDGESIQGLDFGTSNVPTILKINLKFSYTEKENRIVNLNDIKIHFVSNENQKENQKNKQSSSSKKNSATKKSSQQDPFSQVQKRMDNFMNKNKQQSQSSKQRLQNNQMAQDSSALKNQMEKQIKEQQEMKNEFQKQLSQNKEFQKENQDLLSKGYKISNTNLNPESNNSGNFKLEYQKPDGEKASLRGDMKKGKVQNLRKDTPESRQKLLNQLEQNKKFQKFQKILQEQGYSQQDMEFSQENNISEIKINYKNEQNFTSNIKAEIVNNTVKNVELQKLNKKRNFSWKLVFILFLIILSVYIIFKKINRKKQTSLQIETSFEEPFDYRLESAKLVEKSKKLFKKGKYKDAYGVAGRALRLFLSYENNLNKEITNDEIIYYLKHNNKKMKEINEIKKINACFNLCSLVEFAKSKVSKEEFDDLIIKIKQTLGIK